MIRIFGRNHDTTHALRWHNERTYFFRQESNTSNISRAHFAQRPFQVSAMEESLVLSFVRKIKAILLYHDRKEEAVKLDRKYARGTQTWPRLAMF